MSAIEARLAELGHELGVSPQPLGAYVRAVTTGNLVFVAGHGPFDRDGRTAFRGQVGGELTLEEGKEAARLCILACLASLKAEIGDLDRVTRIVKLLGFVSCAKGFDATSHVIDGASDLLELVFGERGRHARAAIGTTVLPFGIPVEIEMVVEIAGPVEGAAS
jgi:enamine deaminase RidA (YjgF/YER057c/UK114 family)